MSSSYTVISFSEAGKQKVYPKPQKILPAMDYNNILLTNEAKRKGRTKETIKANPSPPIAVARRNARERNRVKQVNNGFATLRQHIPTSICAADSSDNGRNKKLSKVETLRMAVEYIRRLEDLLALSSSEANEDTENTPSYSYHHLPSSDQITYIKTEADVIKPNKRSNYQYYEDEENIPENDINDLDDEMMSLGESHLIDPSLDLGNTKDIYIHSMSTGSLSPEMTSEHSLSPRNEHDSKTYIVHGVDPDNFRLKYSGALPVYDENGHLIASWWDEQQLKS